MYAMEIQNASPFFDNYGYEVVPTKRNDFKINECIKKREKISFRKYKNFAIEKICFYNEGNSSFKNDKGIKLIDELNNCVYMKINFMNPLFEKGNINKTKGSIKLSNMIEEQIKLSNELNKIYINEKQKQERINEEMKKEKEIINKRIEKEKMKAEFYKNLFKTLPDEYKKNDKINKNIKI